MATGNIGIVKIDERPLRDGFGFISNHLKSDSFPKTTHIYQREAGGVHSK